MHRSSKSEMEEKQKISPSVDKVERTEKKYQCILCSKLFHYQHELNKHVGCDIREKSYKCKDCPKSYESANGLKYHVNAIHRKIKYQCQVPNCGQYSNSRVALRIHHQAKHDPNSELNSKVPCPICKKMIKKVSLGGHLRNHKSSNRNYKCESCDKTFVRASELNEHKNTHLPLGERPVFHCDLCDVKSTRMSYLKLHMNLMHSDWKSYDCTFCNKTFKFSANLAAHIRTHTGEKPYSCKQCVKAFKCKNTLYDHVRKVHDKRGRGFVCTHCPRKFMYQFQLNNHTEEHKGKLKNSCPTEKRSQAHH